MIVYIYALYSNTPPLAHSVHNSTSSTPYPPHTHLTPTSYPQCIAADTAAGHLDLIIHLPDFAHPIIYHHTPTGGGGLPGGGTLQGGGGLQGEGRAVDVSSLWGGMTGPVASQKGGGQHAVIVLQDPEVCIFIWDGVTMYI